MLRRPVGLALLGLLAGCTSVVNGAGSPAVTTGSADVGVWGEEASGSLVVGEAPEFPLQLDHWTVRDAWSTLPRAFEGEEWTTADGSNFDAFPASMNGCDDQRFLVRWRVIVDGIDVEAGAIDVLGDSWESVSGHEGWMDLDGCSAPGFRMAEDATASETALVDVAVEVQQFWPAV